MLKEGGIGFQFKKCSFVMLTFMFLLYIDVHNVHMQSFVLVGILLCAKLRLSRLVYIIPYYLKTGN